MALTDISNRLTPSVPIELTFAAQPVALGTKFAQLFAHKAASGATAQDYSVYTVVNVGDPAAAQAEVDAIAGSGSEAGEMAYAFVAANVLAGYSNYPAFRICLLPNGELHFGSAQEAILAVKNLRCDFLVSCYPAGDATNRATLMNLQALISGPDRDLHGQFGSFCHFGSIDSLATQEAYAINSRGALVHSLPDSNTASVSLTGTVTSGSNVITALASTAGVYPGAELSGTGIAAGTVVEQVNAATIVMSAVATASGSSEAITAQNVVSQSPQVIAAACAAVLLGLAFPYVPVQGLTVGGLVPPQVPADRIDINPSGASEQALVAGLSPLYVQAGGKVGMIRSRTTYTLLADGVSAATAYFDWQDLAIMNDFREEIYLVTQQPPFNGNPGGAKASLTVAGKLKDEILRLAQDFEDQSAFQGVKALAPQFVVAPSSTSRGRFDFRVPVNVIPGLFVIAGNIQAVTTFDFTL